jgi:hypothetical protein
MELAARKEDYNKKYVAGLDKCIAKDGDVEMTCHPCILLPLYITMLSPLLNHR